MEKFWTIYVITCLVNNKKYVGQTTKNLVKRFNQHKKFAALQYNYCVKLENAIRKYGQDNFIIEKLGEAKTQQEANYLEIYFMDLYDVINNGYNIRAGGINGTLSEETKMKMSLSKIGNKNSFYGKHHSDETKDFLSAVAKERYKNPEDNNFYGKKHTEKSIQKIKIALSDPTVKTKQVESKLGNKNPMFGIVGSQHHNAKLDEEKVRQIKILLKSRQKKSTIARLFNISESSIRFIEIEKTWAHVKI